MYLGLESLNSYVYPFVTNLNLKRKVFKDKNNFLLHECGFEQMDPMQFYLDLWCDLDLQISGINNDGNASTIVVDYFKNEYINRQKYIVKDGMEFLDSCFKSKSPSIVTNGISYFGKNRSFENVCKISCIIIDLDYVDTVSQLKNTIYFLRKFNMEPTFIVNSGTGFHLYYQFENSVPLFYKYRLFLKEVQQVITGMIWRSETTTDFDFSRVQYLSVNQAYRMVGTSTKLGPTFKCTAFRMGKYWKIENFNKMLDEIVSRESMMVERLNLKNLKNIELSLEKNEKISLKKAKELYPEWYQKRIIEKKGIEGWTCKHDLYYWWIRKIRETGSVVGSRYFRVTSLATYAVKCGIEFDQFCDDAKSLYEILNDDKVTDYVPFTEDDLESAFEFYYNEYAKNLTIETISKKSKIEIKRNKRNGRSRAHHLLRARTMRDLEHENWRSNSYQGRNGRKPKNEQVKELLELYPNETIKGLSRISGMSKNTIKKWKRVIDQEINKN